MSEITLPILKSQYGELNQVPHDVLYKYLDDNREGLSTLLRENGPFYIPKTEIGEEVRRRCEQDLEWLAGFFLWETNPSTMGQPFSSNIIRRETHGLIFDFFVKKDKTKSIAKQDEVIKTRVLLYPRGAQKSTVDIADAAQWILNFPEIRICFLTAEDTLATTLVDELKSHFVVKIDSPSLMNLFFPEFCVEEKDLGPAGAFKCPVWYNKHPGTKRREPTVLAISVGANLSGKHFDVMKADDSITNINSGTPEMCKKTSIGFAINKKTLMSYGYLDEIGTRYHEDDKYGEDIEKISIGEVEATKLGPCVDLLINPSMQAKVLIGRAILIKPEVAQRLEQEGRQVTYEEAGEDGCHILLPNIWSYSKLLVEWRDNEIAMEGQLNNQPRSLTSSAFDMPLLLRNTIPFQEMPVRGPISQTWDFAFSDKKGRDYSTGCSVIWDERAGMYVHDLVRGRFTHRDLAKAVVDFAKKWRPFVIGIEDASGSRFLEPVIQDLAKKSGDPQVIAVCHRIDWIKLEQQDDVKRTRMAALQPWLYDGMLKFVAHLPYLQALYAEFMKCLLSKRAKNDIPDVISRQTKYAARARTMTGSAAIADLKNGVTPLPPSRAAAEFNLTYGPWISDSEIPADAFGRLGMGEIPQPLVNPEVEEIDPEPRQSPYVGAENILGSGLFG